MNVFSTARSRFPAVGPSACLRPLALAWLCCAALAPVSGRAQSTATPPPVLPYTGFVTDSNGNALASTAPKNYDVIFRLWNDPAATASTNRLWTEVQTVTVDHGRFNALLGQGTSYSNEARPAIPGLFTATDASSRYIELTVRGLGAGGTDLTLLPRLRLVTSPYAFLAANANKLVTPSGADLLTVVSGGVNVNGSILATNGTVSAPTLSGLFYGTNLTAGSVGSNQLAAGAIGGPQIAAGAVGTAQIVNGAVGSTQLAAGAVGGNQIANSAIGSNQIAAGAVGTAQLANGAVGAAQAATNLVLWSLSPTNIYYSASDVSIGTTTNPRNLTVTGNLNVLGGLSSTVGTNTYASPTPIVLYFTNYAQTNWQIQTVDVKPFAARPGGFKMRFYYQNMNPPYTIRNYEGTMVFEQPGFTTGNTSYPSNCVRGCVTWMDTAYVDTPFTIGTPGTGIQYNTLIDENGGGGIRFIMYDFNPLALLPGGNNQKNTNTTTYTLGIAYSAVTSGYVVISAQ